MSWLHDRTEELMLEAEALREAGLFPFFRRFEGGGPRVTIDGRDCLNFSSNDYLGLSQHPALIRAATDGVARYGTGLGSSPLQATTVRHAELERRLAAWLGRQACAVFPTGFQTLLGVLSTFLGADTTVVVDSLCHACILDGLQLAKGRDPDLEIRSIKHNSVRGLKRVLDDCRHDRRMVVVEGLYSVDGDTAPLAEMAELCDRHGAVLVVDDAHGLGCVGPGGRGVAELEGVLEKVDILVGTFSKAFGGVGGFAAADDDLVGFLKLRARSYVYSASLPVPLVSSALAALDLIEQEPALRRRLEHNRDRLRRRLLELGFDLGASVAHITPIMVGDERTAMELGASLFSRTGVIMLPFVYPGVPRGKARLRCNVTAAHDEDDIARAVEALARAGREYGVIR